MEGSCVSNLSFQSAPDSARLIDGIALKVGVIGTREFRRLRVPLTADWGVVSAQLAASFAIPDLGEIEYTDDEGDRVIVADNSDWQECKRVCRRVSGDARRMWVRRPIGVDATPRPTAVPSCRASTYIPPSPRPESSLSARGAGGEAAEMQRVTAAVHSIVTRWGREPWMAHCFVAEVDGARDVNVRALAAALEATGRAKVSEGACEQGLELFEHLLTLSAVLPLADLANAHYNSACALSKSLPPRHREAIAALHRAAAAGFCEAEYAASDADLGATRAAAPHEFAAFLAAVASRRPPPPAPTPPASVLTDPAAAPGVVAGAALPCAASPACAMEVVADAPQPVCAAPAQPAAPPAAVVMAAAAVPVRYAAQVTALVGLGFWDIDRCVRVLGEVGGSVEAAVPRLLGEAKTL